MTDKPEFIYPRWGDEMTFQHLNDWGEPCQNIYKYTYAGAKGKYPERIYRFARIGDASISPNGFDDIYLDKKYMIVGKRCPFGVIKEYTRADKSDPDDDLYKLYRRERIEKENLEAKADRLSADHDNLCKGMTELQTRYGEALTENDRLRAKIGEYQTRIELQAERIGELEQSQWRDIEITPAMKTAGARSIGNTMSDPNHGNRAAACWNAMIDAMSGVDESIPEPTKD